MKNSTRFISLISLGIFGLTATAQTPTTPPALSWNPAEVGVIFAADQEKFPEVINDSKGAPVSNWSQPTWGQKCVVSEDECGDGAALRVDNLDFFPMQFAATIDISAYRYLHIDFWAQKDDQMCVKCQNYWPGESFVTDVFDLKGGQWTSVDIDLDQPAFTWSKKAEVPQHCINVMQFAGEKLANDFPHSSALYITNIIAHNIADPAGISDVAVETAAADDAVCNLYGRRGDKTYRGIVVCKGRKFIQK